MKRNCKFVLSLIAGACLLAGCNSSKTPTPAPQDTKPEVVSEQTAQNKPEAPEIKVEQHEPENDEQIHEEELAAVELAQKEAEEEVAVEDDGTISGVFMIDEPYTGSLSEDGKSLTVESSLSHYDENWEKVTDFEKDTFVFPVSDDCKVTIFKDKKEEFPFSEKIDMVKDALKGNTESQIYLFVNGGDLTEFRLAVKK